MSKDPLAPFRVWEGQELGDDVDGTPGFTGEFTPPAIQLHYAGGHVTSTAIGPNRDKPAVWLQLVARAIGHDNYHVVSGVVTSDIAIELAEALVGAAVRARADVDAAKNP